MTVQDLSKDNISYAQVPADCLVAQYLRQMQWLFHAVLMSISISQPLTSLQKNIELARPLPRSCVTALESQIKDLRVRLDYLLT